MLRPPFLDIPPLQSACGDVFLPGSKSISNRVLLLAGLCSGQTCLRGVLDSDDTRVMLAALERLGCVVVRDGDAVQLTGIGGMLPPAVAQAAQDASAPLELFLGNAGTAMRPLTAALAMLGGHFLLTGVPRMFERPIGDLVDALAQLGRRVHYREKEGYPPLVLEPVREDVHRGLRRIHVRGDVSSQFLTALLMAAPLAQHATTISVEGALISRPYIDITLHLMQRFGVEVARDASGWQHFTIAADAQYRSPGVLQVEADASSASYFVALGALAADPAQGQAVTVHGVGTGSIQGDIQFLEAAQRMGAKVQADAQRITVCRGAWPLRAVDMDCNHIPDAAMTLAMMALYADGRSTLRNIGSWRVKETDRIAALACELRKLGATVKEGTDFIQITPPASPAHWRCASWHSYDDHRMAMCASLAAFNPAQLPVRVQDPACVGKTYPAYFGAFFDVVQAGQPAQIPVLCIDGPSASGKGTLAAALAQQLGYHLLDSGALYRIVGLVARRQGWLDDDAALSAHTAALAQEAAQLPIRFAQDRVWLADEDITQAIRTEQAGLDASRVSALPAVREALVALQHRFCRAPGLVADGRDMGTVIFPQAALKVFLTASAEKRAQRRYQQLLQQGISARIDDLCADLQARDARDMQRTTAPLKPAQDAVLLDNSALDVPSSLALVLSWWQGKRPFAAPQA